MIDVTGITLRRMRFTALYPLHNPRYGNDILDPAYVLRFARTAEEVGFDALALTEHPAPSAKWKAVGGHDAMDVFTFLGFCAAVTTRIALMPYVMVPGFRSAVLGAKQVATLDVLSGGRLIVPVGTGYLRTEGEALGMSFDDRNDLLDEAVRIWRDVWSGQPVAVNGRFVAAPEIEQRPRPVQHPHPPIWIGGNSARARQRVADYGSGWTPIISGEILARTTRTAPIPDLATLATYVNDLHERMQKAGRGSEAVTIQIQGGGGRLTTDGEPLDSYLEYLDQLEASGVTQLIVEGPADSAARSIEALHQYAEQVINR
jgi:probable F420-dependent oxidoreductase